MVVTIILFIIVLGVLVFVHEFGHFYAAKKSGMKVEEFGFGFPPRLVGIQKVDGKWKVVWGHKAAGGDDTVYSINWIPLGGFVRILGENNEAENDPRSFINKGFWPRFITLVAGVTMNVVLAALIFSIVLMVGVTSQIDAESPLPKGAEVSNRQVAVTKVLEASPAAKAGLSADDIIVYVDEIAITSADQIVEYTKQNRGKALEIVTDRFGERKTFSVQTLANPGEHEGAIGIVMTDIAKVKLPFFAAIAGGFKQTWLVMDMTFDHLKKLVVSESARESVGGPVKIAQVVGQVKHLGLVPLLNLTGYLSVNLAILNIVPFPALDGGRVLFLIIEAVRGRKNNQRIEQVFNTAGFLLLLMLMLLVTIKDIRAI